MEKDDNMKVRNGMVSTSTCTLAKGDGKVKIIWRGVGGTTTRDGKVAVELGDRGSVCGADGMS